MAKAAKKRGRPTTDDNMEQITMRVPKEMIAVVNEISDGRLDRPDRSTILREAMAIGLKIMREREGK